MKQDLKVGIYIPSMNRADFIIRQLEYYATADCPHPIYIGDSSVPEQAEKIKAAVSRLKNKLEIVFEDHPGLNVIQSTYKLLQSVKEKYVCYIGDDDFQLPNSLSKCAEFLENNPDYATVGGHAVSIRTKNNQVYGEISAISDYPTGQCLAETASQRTLDYLSNYYVPLFYVNRTSQMIKHWENLDLIKDKALAAEMVPAILSIIAGQSKKIDCLSFIRQIHDQHYLLPGTFSWITGQEWPDSFSRSLERLAASLSETDKITPEAAGKIIKAGFSIYIQKHLTREQEQHYQTEIKSGKKNKFIKLIRRNLVKVFPQLKYIYRVWIKPWRTGKRYLHYEVTLKRSPYYKDFHSIINILHQVK